MMSNQDKERAEFEAWFMAVHLLPESDWFKRGDDGRYQYVEIQQSWDALQSIYERYQSRIAELEAEVVRLQSDEDRINWLEFEAQDSMSGISAKFMKKRDAHPLEPGYRIYRYHKVHNAAPTLREAIDEARKGGA